jgi:lipopolysaccharide export system protein LptA
MSRLPRLAGLLAFAALAAAAPARAQQPGLLPGAAARTPVEIDATNLKWNDAERMASYEGEVVVTQGEATLHARGLRVYLDKTAKADGAKAEAAPAVVAPIGAAGSADIRRIEADGPVTVVQKDQIGAGDRGEYDKGRGQIVLEGHVVLTQGKNVTAGARLVYRVASRDVVIDGGRERVRSQFVQDTPQGAPQPAAAPEPAAFPGAGNSREPIRIEANRLEWFDATQRAVYSGAVAAVQGEAAMRASRLVIFVNRDKRAEKGAAPGGPGGGDRISRIEAQGPVTITQKDQVATGARAVYDKGAGKVELIGNVTLTQGENVTTGSRMIYDLASKQATMIGGGGGRAQALFTPSKGGTDPLGAPGQGQGQGNGKRR